MILTVDILVTIAQKDVLLIRRAKHPFEDRLVMPGGRVSYVFWIDLVDRTLVETCRAESDAREIVIRSIDSLVESEIGFDHWLALEKMKEEIAHESARVS